MAAPVAVTSRLIVRNLAPSVDEKQLRSHFSKSGEITDVKIMKNEGKSRCFAFVGFRNDNAAKGAKKSLDRSYIGSTRINVDFAQVRGNQSSKGKAAPAPVISLKKMDLKKGGKGQGNDKFAKEIAVTSKEKLKEEYVSTMKRTSAMCWSNEGDANPVKKGKNENEGSDDMSDDDDDDDDDGIDIVTPNLASNKALSDLNYLKAKSKQTSSIDEDGNKTQVKKAKKVIVVQEAGATGEEGREVEREEEREGGGEDDGEEGGGKEEGGENNEGAEGKQGDGSSNRLFVRNLPYSVEESELKKLFNQHGKVSDVFIPVDELKRQKGFAFISYFFPEEAQVAQEQLKECIFQGRPLYISTAIAKDSQNSGGGGDSDLISKDELNKLKESGQYKQWKELDKRKKAMESETGWNASHIRSDAVVDVISSRLNVNKSDFLDQNESNMAVRLAIGETHIISENIDYFAKEGIDLNTLISSSNTSDSSEKKRRRSDHILLIKNIPSSTDSVELSNLFSQHGDLERFLLPPSKLVALVEFIDAKDAKKAFKALSYKRYQNMPLYLEWAPHDAIGIKKQVKKNKKSSNSDSDSDEYDEDEEITNKTNKKLKASFLNDEDTSLKNDENTSIYIKNLSFQTKESNLKELFSQSGMIVRNVFIPKNKSNTSSGYGFVEFQNQASVEIALSKYQNVALDGKTLELKRSEKKLSDQSSSSSSQKTKSAAAINNDEDEASTRTKLLVKNVAFQTSIQEMRELFSTFGTLKSLSMPKKYDGKHRGFAFIDYVLPHEASEAKKQLSKSHFYGRHLIIQWANDDMTSNGQGNDGSNHNVDAIRNKARKTVKASSIVAGINKKGQNKSDGFDEFGSTTRDEDED